MGKFQQQDVEFVNADLTQMAELLFENVLPSSKAAVLGLGEQFHGELKVEGRN